jgi:metal-dependent HD superfamily phosphatase/phosphodiesterase
MLTKYQTMDLLKQAKKAYKKMNKHNERSNNLYERLQRDDYTGCEQRNNITERLKIETKLYNKHGKTYQEILKRLSNEQI